MAIPRKSRFTERISKLRGISPIEKDLLKRIGELVDGGLNNRGPANPGTQGVRRLVRSPILPPPRNIRAEPGPKNAKIEWDPVDSPILLMYEVELLNVTTRLTEVRVAFTNRLYVGGQGTFQARVRSVGRTGEASPYSINTVVFTIQDELLYLEGTGVAPTTTSNFLFEDIQAPADYRIFSWGAFNSADFVLKEQNNVPFMDLSVNGFYPIISTLLTFSESRFFSNVDDSTIVGEVRPGSATRTGMFLTPLAAMFKPFHIDPTNPEIAPLVNTAPKFYMFINNTNDDAAGTNLTLLSIPASVVTIEEETFISSTSIDLGISNSNSPVRSDNASRSGILGIGGTFTIGMWIKIPPWDPTVDTLSFRVRITNVGYNGLTQITPKTLGFKEADFLFELGTFGASFFYSGGTKQGVRISLNGPSLGAGSNLEICSARYNLENREPGPVFPFQGNEVGEDLLVNTAGKWIFLASTFNSLALDDYDWTSFSGGGTFTVLGKALKHELYFGGDLLTRRINSLNRGLDGIAGNVFGGPSLTTSYSDNIIIDSNFKLLDIYGAVSGGGVSRPIRLYWVGLWDGLLADPSALIPVPNQLKYLAENPEQDLRTNSGDYTSAGSLAHWWVFGENPFPTTKDEVSSDLGFSVPVSITKSSLLSLPNTINKLKNDRPNQAHAQGAGTGSDV